MMQSDEFEPIFALRIDVDFQVGLRDAVPYFLEALDAAGMQATFFIVAGSNRPRSSVTRLFQPGYLRRLHGLGIRDVASMLARSVFDRGQFLEGDAEREAVASIRDRGHEIAVHGFDHTWWADNVWGSDEARIHEEIELAYAAMEDATGLRDLAWGSPSWRTTCSVLQCLARRGVPYFSDCWGRYPFLTVGDDGVTIEIPHLPINLPSLEASIVTQRLDEQEAVDRLFAGGQEGPLAVACVHDYFEGLMRPTLFRRLLDECARRGLGAVSLREASNRLMLSGHALPTHRLTRAPLPGFHGEISWQE